MLILPINGAFGNLNSEEAAKVVSILKPKLAVPCHYWNFAEHGGDPQRFCHDHEGKNIPNRNISSCRWAKKCISERRKNMKALVAEGPHKAAFRDVELRPIKDNELLIKVKRAGICATDNAIYTGDCMFVRDGSIVYPCRFGHEWSGVVEKVGKDVTDFKAGDRVICDNGVSCGECDACKEGRYDDCVNVKSVGTVNCWDGCFAEYRSCPFIMFITLPTA